MDWNRCDSRLFEICLFCHIDVNSKSYDNRKIFQFLRLIFSVIPAKWIMIKTWSLLKTPFNITVGLYCILKILTYIINNFITLPGVCCRDIWNSLHASILVKTFVFLLLVIFFFWNIVREKINAYNSEDHILLSPYFHQ